MRILNVGALIVGVSLAVSAQAEAKRYLVKFKSDQTYSTLSKQYAAIKKGQLSPMAASPLVRALSNDLNDAKALNNVKMMVVEGGNESAIANLRDNPAVAFVEEERFIPAPKPLGQVLDFHVVAGDRVELVERPWGIDAVKAPGAWNTTKGNGARVAVLDTGLDTEHVAILSRYEKGRNFTTGNAADMKDEVGHGTHVSGTILADGANNGLIGVAPEARLLMGKVCGTNGCSTVAIAEGINWAVGERVDVINMSLGGMFLGSGEQAALVAAEQAGVMVVAASGNDGRRGVSYPAAFVSAFAVGAIDSTLKKADFSNWGPELDIVGPGVDVISSVPRGTSRTSDIQINIDGKGLVDAKSSLMFGSPMAPVAVKDMVFAGLGKPTDFQGVDVRGKFALIQRGEIAFKDKVAAAIQNGAAGVIIFNNAPGLIVGGLTEDGSEVAVPVTMIEQSVGEEIRAALSAGQSAQAAFGVVPSDYSSFAGTSMATPHVAGVAALVRAANKNLTPAQVRDLLKATASPLGPNDQNQYGAGLVNAEAAVARAISFVPEMLRASGN